MKLAEALLRRADMQKKLASLKSRIAENVKVQDGDTPSENPNELLLQANQVMSELYALIDHIHRTNAIAVMPDLHRLLQTAIDNAKTEGDRYSYREIKWQKVIEPVRLQKQADDIAVKLRNLNIQLQAANWQIDLV